MHHYSDHGKYLLGPPTIIFQNMSAFNCEMQKVDLNNSFYRLAVSFESLSSIPVKFPVCLFTLRLHWKFFNLYEIHFKQRYKNIYLKYIKKKLIHDNLKISLFLDYHNIKIILLLLWTDFWLILQQFILRSTHKPRFLEVWHPLKYRFLLVAGKWKIVLEVAKEKGSKRQTCYLAE